MSARRSAVRMCTALDHSKVHSARRAASRGEFRGGPLLGLAGRRRLAPEVRGADSRAAWGGAPGLGG
eukprot:2763865-Alexandrium_andersonii.AAC.1